MIAGLVKLFKNNLLIFCGILVILVIVGVILFKRIYTVKENFDASSIGISDTNLEASDSPLSKSSIISGISSYIESSLSTDDDVQPVIPPPIDLDELDEMCTGVTEPLKLYKKAQTDISGCGWYFKDDQNDYSFPAYGTKEGPLNPVYEKMATGGTWYFLDLSGAQKAEDIKHCQKIRICELADLYPEKCGFCTSLGYGIPIDSNKLSKYPDDDDTNCQGTIVNNIKKCPKFEKDKQTTRDAKGNIIVPEGLPPPICDQVNGGLSKDCLKFLAKGAGAKEEGHLINIIMGDSGKHLVEGSVANRTFKKVIYILKRNAHLAFDIEYFGNGDCKRSAALKYYVKLSDLVGYGINGITRQAADYLVNGKKFPIDNFMDNFSGPFDLNDLTYAFKECGGQPAGTGFPTQNQVANYNGMKLSVIKEVFTKMCKEDIKSPDSTIQSDSIKKCLGINLTNPIPGCDTKPSFVFSGATCQAGNSFIGDVVNQPKAGVEMFWYSWDNDAAFPERRVPIATFYGREIRLSIPTISPGDPLSTPFSTTDNMAFMARSVLTYKGEIYNSKYALEANEGVAVKINSGIVYRNWIQGTSTLADSNSVKMTPMDTNYNEIYWFTSKPNEGKFTVKYTDAKGTNINIPYTMCSTRIPKGFPIARWDFLIGDLNDRNGILSTSMSSGTLFEKFRSANCLKFNGANSWVKTENKIRGSAFRTFTAMIYYNNFPNTQTNSFIFSLRKTVTDSTDSTAANISGASLAANYIDGPAIEAGIDRQGSVFAVLRAENQVGAAKRATEAAAAATEAVSDPFSDDVISLPNSLQVKTPAGSIAPGSWNHIAVVVSTDYTKLTIYINGAFSATATGVVDTSYYNSMIFDFGSMGLSYANQSATTAKNPFNGGMAWQHWFDYPMCIDDVKMDYKNQFCDTTVYPMFQDYGWSMPCPLTVLPKPPSPPEKPKVSPLPPPPPPTPPPSSIMPSSTSCFTLAMGYGATSNIMYSSDGITWLPAVAKAPTKKLFASHNGGICATWNGSLWVAGGYKYEEADSFSLMYSSDGINWEGSASGSNILNIGVRAIGWNGNMWIAVGAATSKNIIYSSNGINWTATSIPGAPGQGQAMVWNGSLWVCGLYNGYDDTATLAYSSNGITWKTVTERIFEDACYGIAWNGKMFVAVGGGRTNGYMFAYSYDGIKWIGSVKISDKTIFSQYGMSIAWNGIIWMASGANYGGSYSMAYSNDGINWTPNKTATLTSWFTPTVSWNGCYWLAGGRTHASSNTLIYSKDGMTWTNSLTGSTNFSRDQYTGLSGFGTKTSIYPSIIASSAGPAAAAAAEAPGAAKPV